MAVALAMHAGAGAWVAWTSAQRAREQPPHADEADALEIAIEEAAEPVAPHATPRAEDETSQPAPVAVVMRAATSTIPSEDKSLPHPGEAEGANAAPVASSQAAAGEGSWTFPSGPGAAEGTAGSGALAGGSLDSAVRAGVRATLEQAGRRGPRNPHTPGNPDSRDVDLGIAQGGAFATIAQDLVRRSRVPTTGRALLRFDTDAGGVLATVLVLDSSSGRPEWNEVARQMVAEGRRMPPLRVPAGARGLSITVEVTSAMKTLEGGDPPRGTFGKVAGAVMDPIGAATEAMSHEPLKHVVAARVVDVEAF
jgi:hypothetical protein